MNKANYDNPFVKSYSLGQFDYGALGAATEVTKIPIPLGVGRCKIESISLLSTEVFTAGAKIELGTAADPNRYGELIVGTLADAAGLELTAPATQLFDIGQGGKGVVDIATEALVAAGGLTLTLTGAGAAGTGIAATDITLAWW